MVKMKSTVASTSREKSFACTSKSSCETVDDKR